ncbi:MAG: penicillin acylase family protein [Chitinophagaceae bacterium]
MKYFIFAISLLINASLFYVLNTRELLPIPMGSFLSVQEGIWQNAEPVDYDFSENLNVKGINGKVDVYLDDRLVPHIFAEDENDAYFVQGFLHAKFRLWQMEFQTFAAAGRLSEFVGDKAIPFDRNQRRMGMIFAAENALSAMEKDDSTKHALDAYTNGINAYISTLNTAKLPIEYKLLGYKPEKWSNLKSALFTKQMTYTLAGYDKDLEYTNALKVLGEENFKLLYPELADSLYPVIAKGTAYAKPLADLIPPADADSVYFKRNDSIHFTQDFKPNPSNGSNNWAVSGSRTQSGKPILSNDPHLGLTLPSIWFEIQLHTKAYNSYGVSFPGLPGVVIGFNDSIAFGFTNAGRDVKDYYEIKFQDESKSAYWFNGEWKNATQRVEKIKVKGSNEILDTVAYTVFGPVIYDKSFKNDLSNEKAYALRWVAHDTSNILKMWLLLNRAKNYEDYHHAISYFNVPGQNMIFASHTGDIALWQQATFPLRWKGQGLFVMPGYDSSYMWKGYIPMEENPHALNPASGYVSSANQRPADSTYPYFIPGSYEVYRAITINKRLDAMTNITVDDMKALQNDNYNVFAELARPILSKYVNRNELSSEASGYLQIIESWNLMNDPTEKGVTCFNAWWDSLYNNIFLDDLQQAKIPLVRPEKFVLLEALTKDSAFRFIDNKNTAEFEDLQYQVTSALKKAVAYLSKLENEGKLEWAKYKNTTVYHLLKTNAMPFARSGILNGGGNGIVNATQHDHGPSWRMVIEMTQPINAHAVYPGGQSGNPGSKFYDNFIDTWAKGEYYKIFFMQSSDTSSEQIKWTMSFNPVS